MNSKLKVTINKQIITQKYLLLHEHTYFYTFLQKPFEKVHDRMMMMMIIIMDLKLGLITFDHLVIGIEDST
jgi:hypothetical protein